MSLIRNAQLGCEASFIELFDRYRPIIYRLQGMYYLRDFDSDDWLQEGRIVFFETLKRYDLAMGVTIGAFFKNNFENKIKSHLRKQAAYKRRCLVGAVSLEAKIAEEGPDFQGNIGQWTQPADQQLLAEEALMVFQGTLSDLEEDVFGEYLQGLDLEEIAVKQQLSVRQIRYAYERSRRKLHQHLRFAED